MSNLRPSGRNEFEIAVVCALPLEYDGVALLFDQFWDEDGDLYGRAAGDVNTYTTGRMGKFNVVLVLLPHIGKANAASAVTGLRISYGCLRLVLLVGICGGVPQLGHDEVLLGDVVISKTVVQYDLRKQYPDEVVLKNTLEDNLSRPAKDIRSLLRTFETEICLERLRNRTADFLRQLQKSRQSYNYPGTAEDKLFESTYRHKHRASRTCVCSENGQSNIICPKARGSYCHDLQCDDRHLVARKRLDEKRQLERIKDARAQEPAIYFGAIASGDTVMESAAHRDQISREENVIAFETEGAGAWEEMPCIVVKGVCDYADCHKSDKWQRFAAATSACAAKAMLRWYCKTDKPPTSISSECRVSLLGTPLGNDCRIMIATLQAENKSLQEINAFLQQRVSDFIRVMGQLPRQIIHDGCVTVIDALNRKFYFHLDTICTKPAFVEVLKGRFEDFGLRKIEREEWLLEDQDTGKRLDLQKPWGSHIKPGQTLCMSMIFRRRNTSSTQCPKCHLENLGDPEDQIECSCGLTYRRIEEIQNIEFQDNDSDIQATSTLSAHEELKSQSHEVQPPYPRPRPPKSRNDDEGISRYQRVQVINTSFQIQKAGKSGIVSGHTALSREDLQDIERLSAVLATAYGLPEEDCLGALKECETQLLAIRAEFKQEKHREREYDSAELGELMSHWKSDEQRKLFEDFFQRRHPDGIQPPQEVPEHTKSYKSLIPEVRIEEDSEDETVPEAQDDDEDKNAKRERLEKFLQMRQSSQTEEPETTEAGLMQGPDPEQPPIRTLLQPEALAKLDDSSSDFASTNKLKKKKKKKKRRDRLDEALTIFSRLDDERSGLSIPGDESTELSRVLAPGDEASDLRTVYSVEDWEDWDSSPRSMRRSVLGAASELSTSSRRSTRSKRQSGMEGDSRQRDSFF